MRGFSVARSVAGSVALLFRWHLYPIWVLRGLCRTALRLVGVRGRSRQRLRRLSRVIAQVPRGTIKRHRPGEQASPVALRHIDKEPVVVMVLFVEHANAFRFACAGDTENWPAAQRRSVEAGIGIGFRRSEEHTSELQSRQYLVCRLLLEKKKD